MQQVEECSLEQLTLYMTLLHRPQNVEEFNEKMINCLEEHMPAKYGKYIVQLGNFSNFFFAVILEWFKQFKFFYGILSNGTEKTKIPPTLKGKESIVKRVLFGNHSMAQVLKSVWEKKLYPEVELKGTKDSITVLEIVAMYLKLFRTWNKFDFKVMKINRILRVNTASHHELVTKSYKEKRDKYVANKTKSTYNNKVNNIADNMEVLTDDEGVFDLSDFDEDLERYAIDMEVIEAQDVELEGIPELQEEDSKDEYNRVNNINTSTTKPTDKVCSEALLKQSCSIPGCKRNHNPKDLFNVASYISGVMNKTMTKYKSNSSNNINNNNSSNKISNNNSNKYSNNNNNISNNNKNNNNSNSKNNSSYKNHQSYNTPPPYNKVGFTKDNDIEFYELSDDENDRKREKYMFNKLTDDPYLTRYPEEDKEYFNQLRMMVNNITDKNVSDQDLKNILSSFVVQVRLVDNNGKIHPVVVNA